MRIRQGNDFIFLWTIVRSGIPEDLGNAVNIKLHFKNFDCIGEVKSFQIVDGNIVRVEVAPEWASSLGAYRLILSYEFENDSYSDGDRKCVVDVLAFNIVAKTSEADDVTEVSKTTDIMIGFYGLSAYEVWLKDNPESTKEDYYNWLRQPATDAVSLIDDKIEHLDEVIDSSTANEAERVTAETIRVQSEDLRISAETERKANEVERLANEASRETNENERKAAELTRQSSESERNENEGLRVNAESLRVTAETSRQTAEGLRVEAELLRQSSTQEAISNAENATGNANTAAQSANEAAGLADTARTELTTAVNTKLGEADDKIEEMDTTLSTYDGRVTQVESDITQLAGEVGVKMTNLLQNSSFENGVVEPVASLDSGGGGDSTLSINTINPISGNYDARLEVTTPSTNNLRPILSLNGGQGGWVLNHVFYFGMSVRVNSGTPIITSIQNGASTERINLTLKDGFNSWTVKCLGLSAFALIYLDGTTIWDINFDNLIAYDLTAIFGEGDEPTKEEFELLLATLGTDYFEGEITIPLQKIMQWQLALIRKNKNAIIALGGTII